MLCAKAFSIRTRKLYPPGKSELQLGNLMHTLASISTGGRSDLGPSLSCRSGGGAFARLASGPDSSGDLTFTRRDL